MNNKSKIIKVSICFDDWLIYGAVWNYSDYVELLNSLLEEHKIILGGDILSYDDTNKLCCTGCNWGYNGNSHLESNICAQKYLVGLADWASSENLIISLVLKNYNQSN